ncbi:hypothetical protein KKF34_12845 [Myxococcota bacterium]|nr:hypothetical protein [Myxococcota bacterium]MBU1379967.1 hypothetical protein [Myxococcota bacterium]MBU1497754.1 hypothetical protein [Myxococcota bacterium]
MLGSVKKYTSKLFVFAFIIGLTAGLWVEALHHHDDFRDHPECSLFHAASSPGTLYVFTIELKSSSTLLDYDFIADYRASYPVKPLTYSPSCGPPSFPL